MAAININETQFEEYRYGDKPLLVDFWAPWCGYCRRIGPAYEKIAEKFGDQVIVAKLNIDDAGPLAHREGIEVIPTLVLYKGGMELGSMVAPESGAAIQEFLKENL